MNNNKQTKKSLIYSFMSGMGVCSRIVAFGATYTWQAVDGVWDGNISDPAHWRCDTAGSPGYPQSTSDRMDVPANAKAKITIDTDHSLGSLFCLAGSDVTLVSAVNDSGEMAHLLLNGEIQLRPSGARLAVDGAKITSKGNITIWNKGALNVTNGSSFQGVKLILNKASGEGSVHVSEMSITKFTSIYIGGGNEFVIDDATVSLHSDLRLLTDSKTETDGSTSFVFKGTEPKLIFFDETGGMGGKNLQACVWNSNEGDILNFVFHIPENGFASTPIVMGERRYSQYLFGAPYNNGASHGKFSFNISAESPAVLSSHRIEQDLVEWTLLTSVASEDGFYKNNILEGNPPEKASEQIFASHKKEGSTSTYIYAATLDFRTKGLVLIVR